MKLTKEGGMRMKEISEKEFLELIKNAINCVSRKNIIKYKLPNGKYVIKERGSVNIYYVDN